MLRPGFFCLTLILLPALHAQTGLPAVDSAAAARTAWREAARAAAPATALPLVLRAAHAWPTQPAYWGGVAQLAAQAGDTAHLIEALERLAGLGAGDGVLEDAAVARLTRAPALIGPVRRLRQAAADIIVGRILHSSIDSTVYAEGIDADNLSARLYVASVRHRTVFVVERDGSWRDLDLSRAPGVGAVLGVRVAPGGTQLWVTTSGLPQMQQYTAADAAIAALLLVRASDGTIERRWDLPRDGTPHVLGDLAIGPAGDVFVTDSRQPLLFRLRPGADSFTVTRHPYFRSLQGVAPSPDGLFLYIADYSYGLLRQDLRTEEVVRVTDAPGATSLGLDGIVLAGRAIIGVQNGLSPARIARFMLSPDGKSIEAVTILDRQPATADEPTIGTLLAGDFVYVANSQWEKYNDDGQRRPGTHLSPTHLIRVPLSH